MAYEWEKKRKTKDQIRNNNKKKFAEFVILFRLVCCFFFFIQLQWLLLLVSALFKIGKKRPHFQTRCASLFNVRSFIPFVVAFSYEALPIPKSELKVSQCSLFYSLCLQNNDTFLESTRASKIMSF